MKMRFRLFLVALLAALGLPAIPLRAQPGCVQPPAGVIAWWQAEGNANDAFGSHQGSLLNGASCVAGKVGQAFSFDGSDDVVEVPDSPAWDFITNNFTIEFWVKFNRIKDSMFIYQQQGTVAGGFEFDYQTSANQLIFARDPSHAAAIVSWLPQTNVWYHLAVTRSDQTYSVYVNGQLLGNPATDPNPIADASGPIRLGNYTVNRYALDGLLDEMTLYNRWLSATEITNVFAAGIEGKCSLPVLTIAPAAPGAVSVAWPAPNSGFRLQQNGNLATTNWSTTTNTVNLINGRNQVLISPLPTNRFYRLVKP